MSVEVCLPQKSGYKVLCVKKSVCVRDARVRRRRQVGKEVRLERADGPKNCDAIKTNRRVLAFYPTRFFGRSESRGIHFVRKTLGPPKHGFASRHNTLSASRAIIPIDVVFCRVNKHWSQTVPIVKNNKQTQTAKKKKKTTRRKKSEIRYYCFNVCFVN